MDEANNSKIQVMKGGKFHQKQRLSFAEISLIYQKFRTDIKSETGIKDGSEKMNLNMNYRSEHFKPGKRDYLFRSMFLFSWDDHKSRDSILTFQLDFPKTYLQMNKSDLYLLRRFAFVLEFLERQSCSSYFSTGFSGNILLVYNGQMAFIREDPVL